MISIKLAHLWFVIPSGTTFYLRKTRPSRLRKIICLPSTRLFVTLFCEAFNSKTNKGRITKIDMNVSQGMSNRCVIF